MEKLVLPNVVNTIVAQRFTVPEWRVLASVLVLPQDYRCAYRLHSGIIVNAYFSEIQ